MPADVMVRRTCNSTSCLTVPVSLVECMEPFTAMFLGSFRCGIPFAGVHMEYNYIWSSLLQDQNNGNFSSINLMLELGVRF